MNMSTKREVLQANLKEWLATTPYSAERREITKRLSRTLRIHERSVARAMKREQLRTRGTKRGAGRPPKYGPEVRAALRLLFDEMDAPCAENMKPEIDTYIKWLVFEDRWTFRDEVEGLVKGMSIGTMKTMIKHFREKDGTARGKSATVASTLHTLVPVRKSHTWVGLPAGHVQMDTVVHCGDRLTDDVMYSVGAVDFATYWSEYTAQWNKGEQATQESTAAIRGRFPFAWNEMHPDSGTEFLNYHFHRWACRESIEMTRSAPNKKNDNMCIEERNHTIPRRHVGYARIDEPTMVPLAAEILRIACLLHNHFRPVRRMISKERIGARWHRTYEKQAKTPYQRVMENGGLSASAKRALREEHERLNPLELKRELDTLKRKLARQLAKS